MPEPGRSELFRAAYEGAYLLARGGRVLHRRPRLRAVEQFVSAAFMGALGSFRRAVEERTAGQARPALQAAAAPRAEDNATRPEGDTPGRETACGGQAQPARHGLPGTAWTSLDWVALSPRWRNPPPAGRRNPAMPGACGGLVCPILFDAASSLGPNRANTSRVVRLAEPGGRGGVGVVIYLRSARLPFDEYVVAHELVHNTLYCRGLPKIEWRDRARRGSSRLLSALSTVTSHFLVHPRMARYGFDVETRERLRFERFRRSLAHPVAREDGLGWGFASDGLSSQGPLGRLRPVRSRTSPPVPSALTALEFACHLPDLRPRIALLMREAGERTLEVFNAALKIIEAAGLCRRPGAAGSASPESPPPEEAPSLQAVQCARRMLAAELGIAEEIRFVNPFEAFIGSR